MPIRDYCYPTSNVKNIKIRQIKGLPDTLEPKFKSVDIRYHRRHGEKHFFFCTVHLPYQKDDEGYDLELNFVMDDFDRSYEQEMMAQLDHQTSAHMPPLDFSQYGCFDEFTSGSYLYEAQLNDIEFEELKNHTYVCFEVPKHMNYVVLKIQIDGTSYRGMALIDDEYFVIHK